MIYLISFLVYVVGVTNLTILLTRFLLGFFSCAEKYDFYNPVRINFKL
jgi:hypothetical protein